MNYQASGPLGVIYRDIAGLKPYDQNSRAHTAAQVKLVARSIET